MAKIGETIYTDYEALYRELFTPVFRYIFFRTKDYDTANDLTQTTFLKFFRQEDKPKEHDHAVRQMYIIAKNTLIDYWRTERKKAHLSLDDIENIPSNDENPEEIAKRKEDVEYTSLIMKDLNEVEKEIISLRLASGLSYEEISSMINLSIENARKIYSRALQKIKVEIIKSKRF